MAPSGLITHAVICKPRSVIRSVPRITAARASLAASATAAHARSRKAGSGDGASWPGPPIARDEALRKADHSRAPTPGVSNRGCREAHGVVRCRWHADVREGDPDVADETPPSDLLKTAETFAKANALAAGPAV